MKIHYTLEGETTVLATIEANVATVDFIMRGLPGQPEGTFAPHSSCLPSSYAADYRPLRIERVDGTVLDGSSKPPDTVYVVGVRG